MGKAFRDPLSTRFICRLDGRLQRFAILLRLQARGSPSMANPFDGSDVHRTLLCLRLTLAADGHGKLHVTRAFVRLVLGK